MAVVREADEFLCCILGRDYLGEARDWIEKWEIYVEPNRLEMPTGYLSRDTKWQSGHMGRSCIFRIQQVDKYVLICGSGRGGQVEKEEDGHRWSFTFLAV